MKILTFNWHEAFICMLAKTGHDLHIVERVKGGSAAWFYETRPLPPTARVVKEASARRLVRKGEYGAVVCHNLQDLLWIREFDVRKVLVFHNRLRTEIALGGRTVDLESYRRDFRQLIEGTDDLHLVFISESKRQDWDLEGRVILPGIDLSEYGGYRGDLARVLRVGNFMRRRDLMLGHSIALQAIGGRSSTLLGLNEPGDGGRFTRSWDDLKEHFRSHRLYLNTTVHPYEDGYNLAMLEAMATGMPVVALANPTSPIEDGRSGFIAADPVTLSDRIDALLRDAGLAKALGEQARRTAGERFGLARFVAAWNETLGVAADSARAKGPSSAADDLSRAAPSAPVAPSAPAASSPVASTPVASTPVALTPVASTQVAHDFSRAIPAARLKILLAYVAYPATTARYLEASLRKHHEVVTIGPAIDRPLMEAWNLQNLPEAVKPQDLPTPYQFDAAAVFKVLERRWKPDLFLWVESVYGNFPAHVPRLDCPTACYLIDTHLNLPWHLEWAARFDHVFLAQRAYLDDFRRGGIGPVSWLPLACDPAVHGRQRVPLEHDVSFVGSLSGPRERRRRLLDTLASRCRVHVERSFLREMARTFSASRIVFNEAVKHDLNMRVFEALCSGALLLTDPAPGSGLEDLFGDRVHLVLYDDDNVADVAAYYLAHPDEREAIAARGRSEVLRHHTYDHRAATLLDRVFGRSAAAPNPGPPLDTCDPLVRRAMEEAAGDPAAALATLALASRQRELDAGDLGYVRLVESICRERLNGVA